ncbi:protein ATP6V1FNB [Biomphalaria pfeifferi]|uniref:Protein ATP6V1FNB n=1 Tax=Biomphalaria pfeifferi TaxID=112525 RepID=A0AAD8FFJ4_BIOPF|nr:protein ATP6V1FNB [Biomphalaria pfeifferi]
MSRNPFPTTQMQNLWKEAIENEAQSRLAAFKRLKGKPRTISNQAEVYRKRQELNKSALIKIAPPDVEEPRHHVKNADHVIKQRVYAFYDSVDEPKLLESEKSTMRPVSPLVRATLYHGYSKLGEGRKNYLRERYSKNPEDKFIFPLTASWEYGWRLADKKWSSCDARLLTLRGYTHLTSD